MNLCQIWLKTGLCQDTQPIMALCLSSSSNIGDVARHLSGEDTTHGVPENLCFHNCLVLSLPEASTHADPVYVGVVIVGNSVPAIPTKLVVEKHISQEELDSKQQVVQELTCQFYFWVRNLKLVLTCYEVSKIPGVVMKDWFEVFHKFLDHSLHNHPIIIACISTDYNRGLGICTERSYQATLQRAPYFVRQIKEGCLQIMFQIFCFLCNYLHLGSHHKSDPLVESCVWCIISAGNTFLWYNAFQTGLGSKNNIQFLLWYTLVIQCIQI